MIVWRCLVPLLTFAVIAAFFYGGLYRDPNAIESPLIGMQAPAFSLPSVADPAVEFSSEELMERPSLLNVWGTWCRQCYAEHAFLLELAELGVIPVYGLNLKDERERAIPWLATLGDPYIASGFDEHGRVAIDWGVYGAPETFLIGPDGRVLHRHIAPLTREIWATDFIPLIIEACRNQPCNPAE